MKRSYPGDMCYHTDANGKRDCNETRCMVSGGRKRSTLCKGHEDERTREYNRTRRPALILERDEQHLPSRASGKRNPLPFVCSPAFRSVMRRGSLGEAIQAEQRGEE